MRRSIPLLVIVGLALFLSALTVPMSFLAAGLDARTENGSFASSLIRFIWCWGIELTNGSTLSDPMDKLVMYAINFFIFYLVLRIAHQVYLLIRKWV